MGARGSFQPNAAGRRRIPGRHCQRAHGSASGPPVDGSVGGAGARSGPGRAQDALQRGPARCRFRGAAEALAQTRGEFLGFQRQA